MIPTLWINVECTAGTHISDACREIASAATKLGVGVKTDFNGTTIRASPNQDWHEIQSWYEFDRAPVSAPAALSRPPERS